MYLEGSHSLGGVAVVGIMNGTSGALVIACGTSNNSIVFSVAGFLVERYFVLITVFVFSSIIVSELLQSDSSQMNVFSTH